MITTRFTMLWSTDFLDSSKPIEKLLIWLRKVYSHSFLS